MEITTSKALIRYGLTEDTRNLPHIAIMAICKKYDHEKNFQKRETVDEPGKFNAELFTKALSGIMALEAGKISRVANENSLGFYLGIKAYLRDEKNSVMEKLKAAGRVIKNDATPDQVREALGGLRWYEELAKDRTAEDRSNYGAIISRPCAPF
jgi:hypothetical protein